MEMSRCHACEGGEEEEELDIFLGASIVFYARRCARQVRRKACWFFLVAFRAARTLTDGFWRKTTSSRGKEAFDSDTEG